jgi:hypothetical protein
MKFQKGQPRPVNAGRKKGAKNRTKLRQISEILAENGFDPIQEVIDILNEDDPTKELRPSVRAEICMNLAAYCYAKPKEIEGDTDDGDDLIDELSDEQLLRLVKSDGAV